MSNNQIEINKKQMKQINYYIMREMWKILKKRGSGNLYDTLGMSRAR